MWHPATSWVWGSMSDTKDLRLVRVPALEKLAGEDVGQERQLSVYMDKY